MKSVILKTAVFGAFVSTSAVGYAVQDMTSALPNAKAGECYAKVVIPAKYRTESSTIVVKEASELISVNPAKYEWAEERILVNEGSSELRAIPATFDYETQSYEVSPASTRWVMGTANSEIAANPALLAVARAGGADLDSAEPGQCFDEHYKPATYKAVSERVLVSEAYEEINVIPARYEWTEQRVMVSPASRKLVAVPAVFETITEQVKVEDARTMWKKGRGLVEKIDYSSGDVMCLVEVPAVYKTVSKRILKEAPGTTVTQEPARYETIRVRKLVSAASESRVPVPAQYKEVTKQVLESEGSYMWHNAAENGTHFGKRTGSQVCLQSIPAKMASVKRQVVKIPSTVTKVEIPAKYETKKVRRLVSEASQVLAPVAAQTSTMTKRIKVSDSLLEWRPVLCETNMTDGLIQRVQQALGAAGFAPGPMDGVLGKQTMAAVERFQNARGLATGGLTLDTLNKLGVDVKG